MCIRDSPSCVQEQLRLHRQTLEVVRAVLLEQDGQIRVGGRFVEGVRPGDGAVEHAPGGDVRVVVADRRAQIHQTQGDLLGGGALQVGEVGLVGDAQEQHACAPCRLAVLVEELGAALDDVAGHPAVDLLGQFHHAQAAAAVGGQVLREGVAADARAGAEGLEAERLGLRAADHVPQVDAQVMAERGHLVDEGDVDVPVVGLQQLHGFRLAQSTRAYHLVREPSVEGGGRLGAGRGEAADDLRGAGGGEVAVAGVDAAGGVGEVEVAARPQA